MAQPETTRAAHEAIWDELAQLLPSDSHALLAERDGAARLVVELPRIFPASDICVPGSEDNGPLRIWELCGLYYLRQARINDALSVFERLYYHILDWQQQTKRYFHKG